MAEDYGETSSPTYEMAGLDEEKTNNRIWILIAIVLLVLCCCCLIGAYGVVWFWNNGDELFGLTSQLVQLLI
jgi:hypothetical protein